MKKLKRKVTEYERGYMHGKKDYEGDVEKAKIVLIKFIYLEVTIILITIGITMIIKAQM